MATRPDDDVTMGPTLVRPARPSGYAPGAVVAGRYRLVGLLGRGGMGEVYRADDLTLDQPVALKFLPDGVAADDIRLAQFHNELRIARQVSHKNVCRLYDLGDADGRRFLTMEYVDGEDLASLLRRIGRIPQDKAIELARQLCAGVAAAHERGVVHRDLKPANVMIDGEGNVRITDFGIATAVGDDNPGAAGTPQYMAPEQLGGKAASIKTDIYALGLILFEIFTGRRAYDAKTLGDLKQLHDTGTVTTPSSIVRDLDPAVERVILRCLAKDPDARPASALTIAASLPGSDPLAAALAAGETPSPELLAAAGEVEALPVAREVGHRSADGPYRPKPRDPRHESAAGGIPPQRDPTTDPTPAPKWDAMFRAAGLAESAFKPVPPEWQPKDFADARAAWEGPLPDAPDLTVRIEAAAYRGKVTSMYTVGPWARARAMVPLAAGSPWNRARAIFSEVLYLSVIFGGILLARHNLRVQRADRNGAARLAAAYFVMQIAAWIVDAHHLSGVIEEVNSFLRVAGTLLLQGTILWLLYLALEPYGRRFWPDGLLGWSRLLSGRVRDPRFGREILIGSALAGALLLVDLFRSLSPRLIGKPPGVPTLGNEVDSLNGFGSLFGTWTDQFFSSLQTTLVLVMVLVVVRLLVRRTWLAVIIGLAIEVGAAGGGVPAGGVGWLYYLAQIMAVGLITLAIFRYGLLVTAVMILLDNIPSAVPIIPHGASWAAVPGNLSIALVIVIACFGFYAARAGQPLLGRLMADG